MSSTSSVHAVDILKSAGGQWVFCYSKDLQSAAGHLGALLGCQEYTFATLGKGGIVKVDALPQSGEVVAWLIGHGLKGSTTIMTLDAAFGVEIEYLLQWCYDNKFTDVVDTCCEPDARRIVAEKKFKGKLRYYCTTDGRTVGKINGIKSVNTWWDQESMNRLV